MSLLTHIIRDHIVLLDLVDRLALPEFLHLVGKPLLLSAPAVLVENVLFALLVFNLSLSLILCISCRYCLLPL